MYGAAALSRLAGRVRYLEERELQVDRPRLGEGQVRGREHRMRVALRNHSTRKGHARERVPQQTGKGARTRGQRHVRGRCDGARFGDGERKQFLRLFDSRAPADS